MFFPAQHLSEIHIHIHPACFPAPHTFSHHGCDLEAASLSCVRQYVNLLVRQSSRRTSELLTRNGKFRVWKHVLEIFVCDLPLCGATLYGSYLVSWLRRTSLFCRFIYPQAARLSPDTEYHQCPVSVLIQYILNCPFLKILPLGLLLTGYVVAPGR